LDKNKIYKDEEGNDVVYIGSISREEIEKAKAGKREQIRKNIERVTKVLEKMDEIEQEKIRQWETQNPNKEQ
jgi:Ethanolamine utilization protein EutJ (predicted chaperonin)